ncbi:MAG: ExbD/TolR family protein [Gemmatimonadota bacterium]
MRRRFRHGDDELAVRAEINVTSLVDVAFTLLIIFMITAPILQGGVEIDVPKAPATPFTSSEGLVISIERDGQIYLEDTPVTLEEFQATVAQVVRRRGSPTVYVKGDANVPYGVVLQVIGTLKESEIETVSLVAQPQRRR